MFLFAIYTVAVFMVGFLFGLMVKLLIDKEAIREVTEQNRRLHRENDQLKRHEVIEIIDHNAEPASYFEPF